MVCRSTPGNSAITTLARNASNLHDVQVLSLFHEVRAEAPRTGVLPDEQERNRFITNAFQRAMTVGLSDRRREDIGNRFEAARTQDVDARTYYAWRNIELRATFARAAMDTHFATIAQQHGSTPEQAEAAFNELMHRDHRVNGEVPQAPEHVSFSTTHLPRDRGTRYALAMLHSSGPSITRSETLLNNAYRHIAETSDRVAANTENDPANQCPDCGQFAGADHTCPDVAAANTLSASALRAAAANANALNDAALSVETMDSDGAPVHDDDCAEEIRNYGGCRHGNAFSAPEADADPVEHRVLSSEQQILHTARQQVRRRAAHGGDWVTPDGHAYEDRELAVRSAAAGLRESELRNVLQTESGSAYEADNFLADVRSRLTADMGRWQTRDASTFLRYEDAVLHDFYLQRDNDARIAGAGEQNCPDCGQFTGAGHVCDPERVAERRAALGDDFTDTPDTRVHRPAAEVYADPIAAWERELLEGDLPTPVVAPEPTPEPVTPVRRRNATRRYSIEGPGDPSVRMMNVSAVRAIPADTPEVLDGIRVNLPTEFNELGVAVDVPDVTGSVTVVNTGQRRTRNRDRYTVASTGERSLQCTCADYRDNYDCVHIRQATEHIQALLNQRDAVAVAPAAAMNAVGTALRDDYDASLAASQEARADFDTSATNVSYSEDMTAFQSAWDEAKAHFESGDQSLPYMYENATNGLGVRDGGRSIGIEIEVDFPEDTSYTAKQRVAREIYEAGLSTGPEVRPWRWSGRQSGPRGQQMGGGYSDEPNRWAVEFDRSVDDVGGNRGCEIVSPILYDTPETWRNLKTICDIVERNGGKVTPRTGLHINIGAADFNHTVGNHNRLIGIANAYEDVIVRSAHNPASGPNHRGRDYCRPMTMPENGFTSIRQAQRSIDPENYEGSSHRAMINLDHVPAEGAPVVNSTRVEVRIFDGSIDPGRIQANVKMSLGMVNAAVRGEVPPRDQERAGTHRTANAGANGRMRRLRGQEWEADTVSFRKFADTLFSRPEDKKQLTYAFAASRWQRR